MRVGVKQDTFFFFYFAEILTTDVNSSKIVFPITWAECNSVNAELSPRQAVTRVLRVYLLGRAIVTRLAFRLAALEHLNTRHRAIALHNRRWIYQLWVRAFTITNIFPSLASESYWKEHQASFFFPLSWAVYYKPTLFIFFRTSVRRP